MSHHVARLIVEARDAPPDRKAEAEDRCRRAILDLWRERRSLNAPPPLASVERIAEAVSAMQDPGSGWYLRRLEDQDEPGNPALRTALLVDNAAKEIIRWCLCEALGQNFGQDARWLVWLDAPLFSDERDLEFARNLVADYKLFSSPHDPGSDGAKARSQIIRYMKGLAELATALSTQLQAQSDDSSANQASAAAGKGE